MTLPRPWRSPLFTWGAGAAACAFLGARFSSDQRVTAAVWSAAAFAALLAAVSFLVTARLKARREIALLEREIADERAALSMGRRARTVYLAIITQEGALYGVPLAQILTDVMPEGGRMEWNYPYRVALRYADRPEVGGHDEPC